MKLASHLPKGLQRRAAPLVERGQAFLKEFEWTWTKAVTFSLLMWFLATLLIAIVPSWWLYFADQTLGWRQCPCPDNLHFWLFKLRDAVAAGLFSVPFGAFIVIPYLMQKARRRLRSESESRPTGGYR